MTGQTNLPAEQREQRAKTPVVAGGQIAAIIPQTLDETFRLANAISASGLAPRGMDKPEQVMVAVMAGMELGLAPFQAVQSFAVVNNRPSLWGDAIPALLWSRGFKLKEWFDNDDEPNKAFCRVTRPDGEEIERTFSVLDAKAAGLLTKTGPWQTNRKRMLQMRARAFAARDGAADVLRGVQVREEVEDYQHVEDVTPGRGTGMRQRYEARQARTEPGFDPDHVRRTLGGDDAEAAADPETGEIIDAEVDETGDADQPGYVGGEPLKACSACGAAEGVECSVECASWGELDPASWPEAVRQHRQAQGDGGPAGADPAEEQAAAPPAGPDDGFDPMDWATSFTRGLDLLETVGDVEDAWTTAKKNGFVKRLTAHNRGMAEALAKAVNDRVAEIRAES